MVNLVGRPLTIATDLVEGNHVWEEALKRRARDPSFQINWLDVKPLTESAEDPALDDAFRVVDLRPLETRFRMEKAAELSGFIEQVTRPPPGRT